MNIGLFGGTFDPVHRGHLAVARAATEKLDLGRILFVPAGVSPFKQESTTTPYYHRFAMLALALAGEKKFVPSLLEAPPETGAASSPSYTIATVRRLKQQLRRSDKLYFIVGIDAFLGIAGWRESEALFREVEFLVASRPGFTLADVAAALPESIRPRDQVTRALRRAPVEGHIVLPGADIHLLPDVWENISATQVRVAAGKGRQLEKLVGDAVAEYIRKTHLYKTNPDSTPPVRATNPRSKRKG